MKTGNEQNHDHTNKHNKDYKKLFVMALLSFLAMYTLMYAMVNTFSNVISNINQFYMAGLMTMPMIIIELVLKSSMYKNKKLNAALMVISSIGLLTFFILIRQQCAVSDKQFLKSMIPHHSAAILMCEESAVQDPEIKELCRKIILNQQSEIDQMKSKLRELNTSLVEL